MLFDLIKNNLFVQDSVATLVSYSSPLVEHSIAKYQAIKKALFLTAVDQTHGSYLEFGVFTGSSFNFAIKMHKKINRMWNMDSEFIGFDSFLGFGNIDKDDEHPWCKTSNFMVNEEKVLKNIKKCGKGERVRIIKGYFEDTIKNITTLDNKINKARVVLIDCDLKEPARLALEFIRPSIQEGTIILFDEYLCFKGNTNKGEYSAFNEFLDSCSEYSFRRAFDYGYGGRAFIAHIT